ncbi:hypothetical protein Tco_0887221 [Tanacetum coccineum]
MAESNVPQVVDKKGGSYSAIDPRLEVVISRETAKDTWTDLVHCFKGPSNTKENKIMDLKLEYNTFRAKPVESLSHTYTSLPEKWLSFCQGLRNTNHIQTLDLADIYRSFVYENNLISWRYQNSDDEDEDEVCDDEEMVQVKVLMALAYDEFVVGKNHARNEHSPWERPGLGSVKHTKPDTQDSSSKNVSGPVTVKNTDPVITSVPTEVKNNEQESKINELTKLVQMLMDEKINSSQKIQESKLVTPQP